MCLSSRRICRQPSRQGRCTRTEVANTLLSAATLGRARHASKPPAQCQGTYSRTQHAWVQHTPFTHTRCVLLCRRQPQRQHYKRQQSAANLANSSSSSRRSSSKTHLCSCRCSLPHPRVQQQQPPRMLSWHLPHPAAAAAPQQPLAAVELHHLLAATAAATRVSMCRSCSGTRSSCYKLRRGAGLLNGRPAYQVCFGQGAGTGDLL